TVASRSRAFDTKAALSERLPTPPTTSQPLEAEKAAVETVRIPIAKLDARLLQAEDSLTEKALTAQRAAELREVTTQFEQRQREWAKVSPEASALRQKLEGRQPAGMDEPPVAASASLVNFLDWNCQYIRSLENKLKSLAARAQQDR